MVNLEPLPEDWDRAIAVVAHPDDLEYGASSAIADAGPPWAGLRWIADGSSTHPTHAVDVTDHLDRGVASLECHRTYIEALGDPEFDADAWLRGAAESVGREFGVDLAVSFELVPV